MKNNKIYLLALFLSIGLVFNSCDVNTEEFQSVSPVDSFVTTSASIVVGVDATQYQFEIVVAASEAYTADRSVPIEIGSSSTASGLEYSFSGSIDILAGELTGSTTLDLDVDLLSTVMEKTIVLKLVSTSEEISLTYIKEAPVVYEISLYIDFDNFSGETSWEITDSSSAVVISSFGTYSGGLDETTEQIFLPEGDYTFTILDSFGDGICCSWGIGSYELTEVAGGSLLATGGDFDDFESTSFSLP